MWWALPSIELLLLNKDIISNTKMVATNGDYPPKSPLSKGDFENKVSSASTNKRDYLFCTIALGIAFFILLPYVLSALLATVLIFSPTSLKGFPHTGYRIGQVAQLYQFFQQQPKDIVIASLSGEANNLPSFSQRSILVGSEYAIPFHVGYYRQLRQRVLEVISAQYSSDLIEVNNFIEQYQVDFWLLDKNAFTPEYVANYKWLQHYQPAATEAQQQLEQGSEPILASSVNRCNVFETETLVVLEAKCIVE